MTDERRLSEVSPGQRGFRFVGKWRRLTVKANTPGVIVTAAAVICSRHYTRVGLEDRLGVIRAFVTASGCGLVVAGLWWTGRKWIEVSPVRSLGEPVLVRESSGQAD